ncbi:MAG TPA: hypothetical protein VGM33_06160 [Baekduia sp.]
MSYVRLGTAGGAVAAVIVALATAASAAQAAPALHCEASALRATVAGTQTVEPVVYGRSGDCTTGQATPAALLPPLLSAQALNAGSRLDATGQSGTASGGIAHLSLLPTPALIAQLPTEQAIDALANVAVPLGALLTPVLQNLGVPAIINLNLADAVRALVPAPGTALLSADVLEAQATVACQAGGAVFSGAGQVAGVAILGQRVDAGSLLSTVVPVFAGGAIDVSQLDLSKVTILGGLSAGALAALKPLLSQLLPPITLPPSVLDVRLQPNEQVRTADGLTQRALHVAIGVLGRPLLDAVVGEAAVSAAPGTCAPPAAPPPTPTPPAAKAPVGAQSVADALLACSDRKLVLVDVLRQGTHVKLLGAANRAYAGKKVAIRLRATGKVVAHATVRKDGSFQTTAPSPPVAFMATHRKANQVRYRAEIGKERSLPLKLQRRMIVDRLTSKDGRVTIAGRVVRPLTTPVSTIRLVRRASCHKVVLVKRFKPHADGTFRVTVNAPKGQAAAVYRMVTSVREKASNPRSYPTYTLPRGVALDTR